MKTVWVYIDTSKQVGDVDHVILERNALGIVLRKPCLCGFAVRKDLDVIDESWLTSQAENI
jgi:hypothetical protein